MVIHLIRHHVAVVIAVLERPLIDPFTLHLDLKPLLTCCRSTLGSLLICLFLSDRVILHIPHISHGSSQLGQFRGHSKRGNSIQLRHLIILVICILNRLLLLLV